MRKVIFITGVSGTGKSTVLQAFAAKGYKAVDTDYGDFKVRAVSAFDGQEEDILDENKINELLSNHNSSVLLISACESNQAAFYSKFDEIVVLTAPQKIILDRIKSRTNNPYGKTEAQRQEIIESIDKIQPLLTKNATKIIDTQKPIEEVIDEIENILFKQ